MSGIPPNPGGYRRQQQQQQNYPAPASAPTPTPPPQPHLHQGRHHQYPRPQNWQQPMQSAANRPSLGPGAGQAGVLPPSDPQLSSYPVLHGAVPASLRPHQYYHSSISDGNQNVFSDPEHRHSTTPSAALSERSDPLYQPYMIRYPPPQGYYSQTSPQVNPFPAPQQAFAVYPGQVAGPPQHWSQHHVPQMRQMQLFPRLQPQQPQLQQHPQQQAWDPSQFQGYGFPQSYTPSYASPSSSRTSSSRPENLRSAASSSSGRGSKASPRFPLPRQDSVATSLASSENSFSPYGHVAGQSPRPSETSSPENLITPESTPADLAEPPAEVEAAPRSEFVLWCGNVPSDASSDELWSFFSSLPAEDGGPPSQPVSSRDREATQDRHGILSIFIISRSNCAFINYVSDSHLQRALSYFHGKIIRPHDPRCQRLVVRVRKKGDEQMSGVSGQRGKGMHVAWVKEQERKKKEAATASSALGKTPRDPAEKHGRLKLSSAGRNDAEVASSPEQSKSSGSDPSVSGAGAARPSPSHESSAGSIGSSNSFTSTNSSLFRHPSFRTRYFILKSANVEQLDKAVELGQWRTQPHNEAVLDQAFRNSEDVILVFSANQSGNFYGYAKMKGLISPQDESLATSSSNKSAFISSTPKTETIAENDDEDGLEEKRTSTLQPEKGHEAASIVFSPSEIAASTTSPLPLTPTQQLEDSNTYFPPQPSPNYDRTATTAVGASWPPISSVSSRADEQRRASASPSMLVSLPSIIPGSLESVPTSESISNSDLKRLSAVVPSRSDTTTPKSPAGVPMVSVHAPDMQSDPTAVSGELKPQSAPSTLGLDPENQPVVTRRDMINGGNSTPITSSHNHSLGPQDSVSWPDSRAFSELAIRAVIHNLRLEEEESRKELREANQQSQQLKSSPNIGNQSEVTLKSRSQSMTPSIPVSAGTDQIGRPFPIEWQETRPLSFSVVRNLRNPWRDNRQIKVSRDGTELEPSVGKALLEEWEKAARS